MRAATAELLAPWQWWRLACGASRRTEYIWTEGENVALYWGIMYISRFASFWENAEPVTKVNLVREKVGSQAIGMAAPMASPWDIHFW